jgi:tetratricopeptide (TPR) repeat protein
MEAFEDAIEDFTRAIEIKPDDAFNYQSRGVNYAYLKDYAAAIADYTHAFLLMPENASHIYLRAQAHFEAGSYQDAIADYTRAIELDPAHKNYYEIRAFAYHRLGRYHAAVDDFASCIRLAPDDTLCYYWHGIALLNSGDYQLALRDLEQSQQLDPDDPVSQSYCCFWRGVTYALLEEEHLAAEQFSKTAELADEIDEEAQRWRLLAILALIHQDEATTRSCYERVLAADRRASKLFSPHFYLIQLTRLYPQQELFQRTLEWFAGQMD